MPPIPNASSSGSSSNPGPNIYVSTSGSRRPTRTSRPRPDDFTRARPLPWFSTSWRSTSRDGSNFKTSRRTAHHEHNHDEGRHQDLLQGLGNRAADSVLARLAPHG